MEVVGACPDAAAVRGALSGILSADEVAGVSVVIQDLGPHYRIVVRDTATTLDDPGTRMRRPGATSGDRRGRRSAVAPSRPGSASLDDRKGDCVRRRARSARVSLGAGRGVRGALGSGRWSLVGAAGARGPATLSFEGGWKAELLRFPLDVGARVTWYLGFRPWLVVGGSVTPTAILGQDLVETDRQWRLDLGALAMVGATLRLFGRIGVAAAINLRWQPRPYHLQVVPEGTVGETPSWWLGLSLNYTLDGKASSP